MHLYRPNLDTLSLTLTLMLPSLWGQQPLHPPANELCALTVHVVHLLLMMGSVQQDYDYANRIAH